jgi:hypothetical protein
VIDQQFADAQAAVTDQLAKWGATEIVDRDNGSAPSAPVESAESVDSVQPTSS